MQTIEKKKKKKKKKMKYAEKRDMVHNTDTKGVQIVNYSYFSSDGKSSGRSCFVKISRVVKNK
jgi:hypothetical protein